MGYSELLQSSYCYMNQLDRYLTLIIASSSFGKSLLVNLASRYITEVILVISVILISYETLYWSGIYLGLWEYHAKDIFTEIPVHCAHVYVRVNIARRERIPDLEEYYHLKKISKFNILNWNTLSLKRNGLFENGDFIKYHFEFSPEDFEMNPEPEYGSTVDHLRSKTINLFLSSQLFKDYKSDLLSKESVFIFNKNADLIPRDKDNEYLVKCDIETGDVIDCIIIYP